MFPQRLRELRASKGLSTRQLAEAVFIAQPNVVKMEHGVLSPGVDLLNRLADYFNVTTDYLLGRAEQRD